MGQKQVYFECFMAPKEDVVLPLWRGPSPSRRDPGWADGVGQVSASFGVFCPFD